MKKAALILSALGSALLVPEALRAELLVYEGFNNYASGSLSGQLISSETVGLNTGTQITSAGAGALANVFNSVGMSFSDLAVSGGSGLYSSPTGGASYIGFAYSGPTATGTVYSSYLTNIQTPQNAASSVGLRVNTTSTTGGAGSYFYALADAVNSVNTGNQYDASAGTAFSAQSLALNTTYLVIGRFSRVGESLSAATPGQGTTFVLTSEQFDTFKSGGITDEELDGAPVGSGPGDVFSRVSDANVTNGAFNVLAAGRGIQFGPGNAGVSQTVAYDEFRFGTTLGDVTAIPEPGTAATFFAGAALLAGLRRRRAL